MKGEFGKKELLIVKKRQIWVTFMGALGFLKKTATVTLLATICTQHA